MNAIRILKGGRPCLGVIDGQNIVPAAHSLSLINSLQHDLVEQLVGHRRDLAQVRQQRSTERVTSSAISVVEHFAAVMNLPPETRRRSAKWQRIEASAALTGRDSGAAHWR